MKTHAVMNLWCHTASLASILVSTYWLCAFFLNFPSGSGQTLYGGAALVLFLIIIGQAAALVLLVGLPAACVCLVGKTRPVSWSGAMLLATALTAVTIEFIWLARVPTSGGC